MGSRVALVTTFPEVIGGEDVDLEIVVAALERVEVDVDVANWHDPAVEWASYDLVVMRSPWDYPECVDEFMPWLDRTQAVTSVLNCPDLIRWNLDKSYLLELASDGVPVVPTSVCDTLDEVERAVETLSSAQVVIKPNISVGSRHAGLFDRDDRTRRELAGEILSHGKRVLVEPAIPSVAESGERDLVYFDGEFSHALAKGPILSLGGGLLGGHYSENVSAAAADENEVRTADLAVASIRRLVRRHGCDCENVTPLYARFDLVEANGTSLLLEAELFEPSYFLSTAPGAEDTFARAVVGRLRS